VPHYVAGLDLPHVVQGWEVMQGKATSGNRVAIVSQEDYYETACVADFLASKGKQVTVFHKNVHLGWEIARYSLGMAVARMESLGVAMHPNLTLTKVDAKGLDFISAVGTQTYRHEGFDSVVLVYGAVAQQELYDELKADGGIAQLYVAGAAWLPRRMAEATRHGANVGLVI